MKKILISVFILLYATCSYADDQFINIFALVDTSANKQVKTINHLLKKQGLYQQYSIKPFADNHILHLTMYLTYYDDSKIPNILKQITTVAEHTNKFSVNTNGLELKASNFLMWNVKNNDKLQNLSNRVVAELSPYRSKNITIPAYAKKDPIKINMFEKYGSPNVYNQFEPHFSIFYANNVTENTQKSFQQSIQASIANMQIQPQSIKIIALGVGVADINGQITKIIKIYKLS